MFYTIFLWIGLSIAVSQWAFNRGRNSLVWLFFALVCSPLLAGVFLAIAPKIKKKETSTYSVDFKNTKKCPRCAEDVKQAAQVCRFCGHEFTPERKAETGRIGL